MFVHKQGLFLRRAAESRRALTLFELAVVVLIAVILLGLAMYSSDAFVTRTKVSRVREEHRVVARALQNYSMDYSDLPSAKQGLNKLVRPTAYLGQLPADPFQQGDNTYLYLFPNVSGIGCVLISPGPDGDFDLPFELWDYVALRNIDRKLVPVRYSAMMRGKSMSGGGGGGTTPDSRSAKMNESELAVLNTYIKLGQYDMERGGDGDIITVLH